MLLGTGELCLTEMQGVADAAVGRVAFPSAGGGGVASRVDVNDGGQRRGVTMRGGFDQVVEIVAVMKHARTTAALARE